MPAQENPVTTHDQVVDLALTFAAKIGFTVSSGGEITIPGGSTFGLTAVPLGLAIGGRGDIEAIGARAAAPRRGSFAPGKSVVQLPPTKCFLFGGTNPTPYMAIVIAYGFNLYRHLYFGRMLTLGGHGGGEVMSAAESFSGNANGGIEFVNRANRYLFQGLCEQDVNQPGINGGVRAVHADNPYPIRTFSHEGIVDAANAPIRPDRVFGGFNDGFPSDGHMARGRNVFAGGTTLTPFNLYASTDVNTYVPLGIPTGVRGVNMTDLDPEQTIDVGNLKWKVFPAAAKSNQFSLGISGDFPAVQVHNSYLVGYAYLADGAP